MNSHEFAKLSEEEFIKRYKNFTPKQRTELHSNLPKLGYTKRQSQYFVLNYSKYLTRTADI